MRKAIITIIILFLLTSLSHKNDELHKKDVILQLNEVSPQEADKIFFSDSLIIDTDIYSSADVVRESSGSEISSLSTNLSFFPKETLSQDIISMQMTPRFDVQGDSMIYNWDNIGNKIEFDVKSQVRTKNNVIPIKTKVQFPIQIVPQDVEVYTRPTEKIDIDQKMIDQANILASGEDDLFQVVFNLAQWVKTDVNYNLSTVTAEAAQKASWVFDNRQGVCDEITVLFISLARSLGIPARFVSGIAYTNSDLFPERWGPHGWAEVYFPGSGWIPFDVTYGEFGYVDASHIVTKISADPSEPSVKYEWLANGAHIDAGKLNAKAELVSYGNPISPPISVRARPLFNNVGFGSYDLIEATVQNLKDYYVAADIFLNRMEKVSIVGDIEQPVLLKPKEERKIFWIVRTDEDLNSNFVYEFPISVYTYDNINAGSSFGSSTLEAKHSRSEMDSLLASLLEERAKTYSKNVLLDCISGKTRYYTGDMVDINCTVKNTGNVALNDLSICIGVQCKSVDLGISQQKIVELKPSFREAQESLNIFLKGQDVTKVLNLPIEVLDKPNLQIADITSPSEAEYTDSFEVKVLIRKLSKADPQNVTVSLSQNGKTVQTVATEINGDKEFIFDFLGSDLDFDNRFNVTVSYEDSDKNKYSNSKSFEIKLKNLTFWQRIAVYINRIGRLFR